MEHTDRKRFAIALMALPEIYGKSMSDAVVELWWQSLTRFSIESVESALRRHIQSPDVGQFMPKPADIVRMLEGTAHDTALVAWTKVDKAVRQIGQYQTVAFDDAIIHRVIDDMGGWIGLGMKTDDEWPFVANEFRTRYLGYKSRGENPEFPARLVGLAEADHSRRGLPYTDVVLIGNVVVALDVVNGGTAKAVVGMQRVTPKLGLVKAPMMELHPEKAT